MRQTPPILVFSHLRWDFVFQRPQHLLSRLARKRRVIFIEEPEHVDSTEAHWRRATPQLPEANVLVCRPCTAIPQPGFCDEQLPTLQMLVRQLLLEEDLRDYAAWFYTPMALPLLDVIAPKAVIFDVMDELSAFKFCPPQLIEREKDLLARADVVFTGGPSLYKAKKDRHANCHCFPSSVDAKHFARATQGLAEHPDQANIPRPRLGFFGVIDERFDAELLDKIARAKPDWHFVLVGPVVKIDPATLPKHANIHYMGQRKYEELPSFLAGWDVALLPFALNESTKFISPTKTLEYMAAKRPIVSTPITDVVEPYSHVVEIARTPEDFIAACEKMLSQSPEQRQELFKKMDEVLAKTSWDRTAEQMEALIDEAMAKRSAANQTPSPERQQPWPESREEQRPAPAQAEQAQASKKAAAPATSKSPVVVIGAGPTGLSATYHLGKDALLLEKNDTVGGWCRSIQEKGFTFDFAGHIMFSNDKYVHELYQKLLGDNVHWQDREAWIYSKEVYTRYPFQGCLYGLPPEVIKECIVGAIEARFGPIKAAAKMEDAVAKAAQNSGAGHGNGNGHANGNGHGNGHAKASDSILTPPRACAIAPPANNNGKSILGPGTDGKDEITDCCGDGVMEATAALSKTGENTPSGPGSGEPKNFEEFIYKVWGKGIAKHFAIPYNRKIWAVDLKEMETSWLGGRVPMPDIEEMILYSLTPAAKPMGPNARFGYPLKGGFQSLMNGFLPFIGDQVRLNTGVKAVSPSRHTVTLTNGDSIKYDYLVSTMPLPLLVKAMGDEAPEEVKKAAAGLRYTNVRCVNIGVAREKITDKHWIYYPEDTVFHRIFVQGNASPHCNPPGGFGFTCEITYGPQKPLPCDGQELIDLCIKDAKRVGFIREDDQVLVANQVDMPCGYVVYDHARPKNVKIIRDWLLQQDIVLAGRYSEWEYYNSDHAFIAGRNAADRVRQMQKEKQAALARGDGQAEVETSKSDFGRHKTPHRSVAADTAEAPHAARHHATRRPPTRS